MTIEISSDHPKTIELLKKMAAQDKTNITELRMTPMEGKEVFVLLIQNFEIISAGAVAIIAALRANTPYIRMSKDGIEIGQTEKQELLRGKKK